MVRAMQLLIRATSPRVLSTLAVVLLVLFPFALYGESDADAPHSSPPTVPPEQFKQLDVVFEPDAYYTNIELILALTKAPIPHLGEKTESEIYGALLSQSLTPRFLVLEASINPLPYLGTYIKDQHRGFYDNAQIAGSFNWVQALTAGFEEPYAASALVGNVVDFDIPGGSTTTGKGYTGYLFSAGNYHIKDNELIKDDWREFEWKIKGDRKSPIKKLGWSFRIGAKFHGNPDITDIYYLSFRRSRLDYQTAKSALINNSGFEYTLDLDRKNFHPIRHYFLVDKKWPIENGRMALSLALGFVWESADKYTGELATSSGSNFQFIIRPNIEF